MKIKITKNGPYIVTGGVPLKEQIIVPDGLSYKWQEGRKLPQAEQYALCRCGKSKNHPFCDGSHVEARFIGTETASREPFIKRARHIVGPKLDLLDDGRCAFARFCHRDMGDVWLLVRSSDDPKCREQAIEAANECPTGRLVAVEKTGEHIVPHFEPSIDVMQDPQKDCSGGLVVKGDITIEAEDGHIYEKRSSVVLCRCGRSRIKPFCDAMHVSIRFNDKKKR